MVLGYVFAWSGHFLIERNRPSVLAHPVWSFQCDVRMLWLWLGGRLNEERARAASLWSMRGRQSASQSCAPD